MDLSEIVKVAPFAVNPHSNCKWKNESYEEFLLHQAFLICLKVTRKTFFQSCKRMNSNNCFTVQKVFTFSFVKKLKPKINKQLCARGCFFCFKRVLNWNRLHLHYARLQGVYQILISTCIFAVISSVQFIRWYKIE